MATAIPAAKIKVFPTANDINGGSTGSGNIVTEANMKALLASVPSRNFVISGLEVTITGDETVQISAGSAFIGGYYVEINDDIDYTLGTIPTGVKGVYFYLTAVLGGTPLEVTGGQFEDTLVDSPFDPPTEGTYRVSLATAITGATGDLEGTARKTKANYGGGAIQGYYVGTGDASDDIETLVVNLGFSPSFVYVAGATGSGSFMVSCSTVIPPTCKGAAQMFGGYDSVGWCMVSSSTINTHPKFYTGTATWTAGQILTNKWGTQEVTIGGVRRGDLVTIGGDNFFDGGVASNAVSTESILRDIAGSDVWDAIPVAPGYMNKDDEEIGYVFGSALPVDSTNKLIIGAYASADDTVTWGMYNCDNTNRTPSASATASFVVQSAWEMQTSTQSFLEGSSATSETVPYITDTGFNVSRTVAGVAGSGQTLNTAGQKYFYWAFS